VPILDAMAVTLVLVTNFVLHVTCGAPAPQEKGGFLQQKQAELASKNVSFPVGVNSSIGITESGTDSNLNSAVDPDNADRVFLLQNDASECKDSKPSCIDRAFQGDCKSKNKADRDDMQANCQLSCGVCSNIWCQSGIFCSSDSAAHSSTTDIRFNEKCHGYCFPKSCSDSWEKCVSESHTGSKAEVCSKAKQVNCYVPLEHTPISDQAASQALDVLLADLKDEPDKMNIIDKHRKDILGYLVRGIGPESVPKAILPDEPKLKASAALGDELAPLAASGASIAGCITDIAAVSVDSVFLVASITRLGRFLQRPALTKNLGKLIKEAQATAKKFGPGTAVAERVYELSATGTSAWKKAAATFSIFASTASLVGLGQLMRQIRLSLQNVSWWRWLWMGVQVGAQLAAWVASDGLAFIAQAVGAFIVQPVGLAFIVSDAVSLAGKLRQGCGSSTTERPPAPVAPRRRRSPPSTTATTTTTKDECRERAVCELPAPRAQGSANLSSAALPRCLHCCSREPPASICDAPFAQALGQAGALRTRLPINQEGSPAPVPDRQTVVGTCERPGQSRDPFKAPKEWALGICVFWVGGEAIEFNIGSGSCIGWVRAMPSTEHKYRVKASLQLCAEKVPSKYLPNAILLH